MCWLYSEERYSAIDNEIERILKSNFEVAECLTGHEIEVAEGYANGTLNTVIYDLVCVYATMTVDYGHIRELEA